ncbi:Bcr/CflA family efflux MFS transporter [Spiractinospora alimapuensis]|uniref:Bcr/CflA family efflux MFS transporter n=1 Tax=Spiractinospora alimapuensis TaxID=2820884 RepID=UPI001F2E78DB|nr:Bcr/CflA family efflux MFS transporter [Spiractinospora alimapuensis]QVQ50030.1 Bcr/CflA family efflux MFS transporter [Spiractinospora alimapuensis]
MLRNPVGRVRLGLALLLGMLAILGPLNVDMYLPGFPDIAAEFDSPASLVQLSLTTCLVGMAVGQMVIGPISDARGRRGPLVFFLSLFVLSSFLCAVAPNITTLVVARFLQGFTGSAGVVLSRAVVRDVFTGPELTRFFALVMMINASAPIFAPVLGGGVLVLPNATWHWIFVSLGLLGVVIVSVTAWRLPETLAVERRVPSSVGASVRTMWGLLTNRSFMGYALVVGLIHGGSFAYVAGTPFVYQDIYGVSPQTFGILFGVNGVAIILGNAIVGRLSGRVHERDLLRAAVTLATCATVLLLVVALFAGPLAAVVGLLFAYMLSMGMIVTTSFSLGMRGQQGNAGSASALLGTFPLSFGALVAPLVGLNEASAVPMALTLCLTSAAGATILVTMTRKVIEERTAT